MKAYITLLSTRSYLDGVLTLNDSLRKVGAKYPLYCLLSQGIEPDVTDILDRSGIQYIHLKGQVYSNKVSTNKQDANWDFSSWNYTFDKLRIWGLTQFEKIVFIDSDIVIVRNIDHLFERDAFTASLAGVLYPTNHNLDFLNSGLMVVEPNSRIEEEMVDLAQRIIPEMQREGKPVGDQDVINAYFPDWFCNKELILDDGYNLYAHYLQYHMRYEGYTLSDKGNPIYAIHYVGSEKPWMINSMSVFCKMCKRVFPNVYFVIAVLCYKWRLGKVKNNLSFNK